jgi:hypothetical protein
MSMSTPMVSRRKRMPGTVKATAEAMSPPMVPPAWATFISCTETCFMPARARMMPADAMTEKIMGQGRPPRRSEM